MDGVRRRLCALGALTGSMRWLLAAAVVVVLFGASEALAFARPASVEGEHSLVVPAAVRFDRTFEWRAEYVQTPALLARTMANLHGRIDASGTEGWGGGMEAEEARGLRIETTLLVNGENATFSTLQMLSGGAVSGELGDIRFSDAWRVGANDVVLRARVVHEPLPDITGQYDVTLGPMEITHRSWLDPPCRPRSACD